MTVSKFAQQEEYDLLKELGELLVQWFVDELEAQGHRATGRLIESIAHIIVQRVNESLLNIEYLEYGMKLETGVKPGDVPFGPGTSRARSTDFIKQLTKWVQVKRIATQVALAVKIAVAIAIKMSKEGIPTSGAHRFSSNGRRTGFQSFVLKSRQQEIEGRVASAAEAWVNARIIVMVDNVNKVTMA
jgi:hypothetical protein